jgi:hypothetical protein
MPGTGLSGKPLLASLASRGARDPEKLAGWIRWHSKGRGKGRRRRG